MSRTSPLIKRFTNYLTVERGLSLNTIAAYKADLLRLQNWASANDLILRGLNTRDLDRHIGTLTRANLNAVTIDRALSAIRTFYDFLAFENEITLNPTRDLQSLKKTRPLPHVLAPAEGSRLLNAPDTESLTGLRDRALLELLYATGLRISEIISIRHCDVSLEWRLLQCVGKGHKERRVPFTPTVAHRLRAYIQRQHPRSRPSAQALVFLNQGKPLTRQFAWTLIKRYAADAGIPTVTPHSLRHTFATSLLNNGAPTRVVQQLLGHSSISTTEIYLSVSKTRLRETYDSYHPRACGLRT